MAHTRVPTHYVEVLFNRDGEGGWGDVRLNTTATQDAAEAGAAPSRLAGREVWLYVDGGQATAARTTVFTAEGSMVWNHKITKAEAAAMLSWALKQIGAVA